MQRLRKEIDGATKREAAKESQIAKLQEQLTGALAQLAKKDAEHSVVLRSLTGVSSAVKRSKSASRPKATRPRASDR